MQRSTPIATQSCLFQSLPWNTTVFTEEPCVANDEITNAVQVCASRSSSKIPDDVGVDQVSVNTLRESEWQISSATGTDVALQSMLMLSNAEHKDVTTFPDKHVARAMSRLTCYRVLDITKSLLESQWTPPLTPTVSLDTSKTYLGTELLKKLVNTDIPLFPSFSTCFQKLNQLKDWQTLLLDAQTALETAPEQVNDTPEAGPSGADKTPAKLMTSAIASNNTHGRLSIYSNIEMAAAYVALYCQV